VQTTITSEELVAAPAPSAASAPSHRSASPRAALFSGSTLGLLTAAVYFINSGRGIGMLDSSITVGAFVKTRSITDPLHRTLNVPGFRFNNHPLFSLIEHTVWSAGFHSESALRVAPILFGALAVGLLTWECARRFGVLAGVAAGSILAVNPLFVFLSRELRDYSLITLCAVASTIILVRMLERDRRSVPARIGYVLIVAAGLASHLWFAPVVLAHIAIVFAQRKLSWRWILDWLAATMLGLAIYVRLAEDMFKGQRNGYSNRSFPTRTAHLLLGHSWVSVAILAGFVGFALFLFYRTRVVLFPALALAAFFGFVWLVIQPVGLSPRFVVWLIPVVGLAVAVVVSRKPWAAVLVAVAVIAMVADQTGDFVNASPDVARAAAIIDVARARHLRVCGYKGGQWAVLAYTTSPPYIPPQGISGCDVIVAMKKPTTNVDTAIQAEFRSSWEDRGKNPIVVYSRYPIRAVLFPPPRLSLDTHPRTYP
jgi:hypothetical protein